MITKMRGDRSRIDNGADPLKFPNFPSITEDEMDESEKKTQVDDSELPDLPGEDFVQIIETMRR